MGFFEAEGGRGPVSLGVAPATVSPAFATVGASSLRESGHSGAALAFADARTTLILIHTHKHRQTQT